MDHHPSGPGVGVGDVVQGLDDPTVLTAAVAVEDLIHVELRLGSDPRNGPGRLALARRQLVDARDDAGHMSPVAIVILRGPPGRERAGDGAVVLGGDVGVPAEVRVARDARVQHRPGDVTTEGPIPDMRGGRLYRIDGALEQGPLGRVAPDSAQARRLGSGHRRRGVPPPPGSAWPRRSPELVDAELRLSYALPLGVGLEAVDHAPPHLVDGAVLRWSSRPVGSAPGAASRVACLPGPRARSRAITNEETDWKRSVEARRDGVADGLRAQVTRPRVRVARAVGVE